MVHDFCFGAKNLFDFGSFFGEIKTFLRLFWWCFTVFFHAVFCSTSENIMLISDDFLIKIQSGLPREVWPRSKQNLSSSDVFLFLRFEMGPHNLLLVAKNSVDFSCFFLLEEKFSEVSIGSDINSFFLASVFCSTRESLMWFLDDSTW